MKVCLLNSPYPSGGPNAAMEIPMNEDLFNIEIRKFLKRLGVTSQRAIENAVHEALKSGKLKGKKSINARMTLTIDSLGFKHEIADDIAFE
jgi:hypothetical protein